MLNRYLFWLSFFLLVTVGLSAQLTSIDLRQSSGKGPYPIYLNVQYVSAGTRNSFGDFTRAYTEAFGEDPRRRLIGAEANIGIIINDENFLGRPGFWVHRLGIEFGYRYLERKVFDLNGSQLSIAQELMSLRVSRRSNILYPITFQAQVGVVLQNTASVQVVTPTSNQRLTIGDRLFSHSLNDRKGIFNGLDLRAKLMILDPAGTTGGIGFFLEGQYFWNGKKRDISIFYDRFLNQQVKDLQSWNHFSWSLGLVVPLALPIPSSS